MQPPKGLSSSEEPQVNSLQDPQGSTLAQAHLLLTVTANSALVTSSMRTLLSGASSNSPETP